MKEFRGILRAHRYQRTNFSGGESKSLQKGNYYERDNQKQVNNPVTFNHGNGIAKTITCLFSQSYLRSPIECMKVIIIEPRRSTTTVPDYDKWSS